MCEEKTGGWSAPQKFQIYEFHQFGVEKNMEEKSKPPVDQRLFRLEVNGVSWKKLEVKKLAASVDFSL